MKVGNVIQLIFSNKLDARPCYAEAASRFERVEHELERGTT